MRKSLIILFLFIAVRLSGTTYYVSSSTGNNGNAGTTTGTAWSTVAWANAHISAGDQVLFKRGDTWREQMIPVSGTAGAYTFYGVYGEAWASKPLFLGSKEENSTSDWVNIGGNIWRNSDASFTLDVGNIIFNNGSTCGIKIMSASPSFTSQNQFWYDFLNDWIQIYSVGNPANLYTDIECATNKNALTNMSGKQYITFSNLNWRYWGGCVWAYDGNYLNFWDCNLGYIGGSDQFANYATRYGNGIQMWQGVRDINIERCWIDNCYDAGISPQGYTGSYTAQNLTIRCNLITNCEYGFEFYFRPVTATATNIYFEHNVVAYSGSGWGHNQRPDAVNGSSIRIASFTAVKSNIRIMNNIFFEATERLLLIGELTSLTNVTVDYNLYYNSVGYIGRLVSTNYSSFATWAAALSQEVNGVGANPLFVSPTTDEFELQAGSPAIGEGLAVVGVVFDYALNNWIDPPSMGAYEYIAGIVVPTLTTNAITDITDISASSGGNISSAGGGTVSDRGVCWGVSANPTIVDSHSSDGTGIGYFASSIIGLTPGLTYHVRAYALNETGYGYGQDRSFEATEGELEIGGTLLKHNSRLIKSGNQLIKKIE